MVERLVVEEAAVVEAFGVGAEDVFVGVELAKGAQEGFAGVHGFAADGRFGGHFAGDGGVVVEAEDFVPDGVEVGAVGQEDVDVDGSVGGERFGGLEADVGGEMGVVDYVGEDPEGYFVRVVVHAIIASVSVIAFARVASLGRTHAHTISIIIPARSRGSRPRFVSSVSMVRKSQTRPGLCSAGSAKYLIKSSSAWSLTWCRLLAKSRG